MRLRTFATASDFLDVTEEFLLAQESKNSLPLGLALRCRDEANPMDVGSRFFCVESAGEVLGTVSQTRSRPAVFTGMQEPVARFAAEQVWSFLPNPLGCNGPRSTVDVVADTWRSAGLGKLEVQNDLRLFELRELTPPRPAPGRLRPATQADYELCQRWSYRFLIDCKLPEATPGVLPERVMALEDERLFLWEVEGLPVACAAWSRPIQSSASIGFVYTPDEERSKGYASNVVAALSRGMLDGTLNLSARRYVNLFTDLANPTSNSIYQKMGYRPIEDFRLMHLPSAPD